MTGCAVIVTNNDKRFFNLRIAVAAGLVASLTAAAFFWSFDAPWTLRGDNKAVIFPMNLEAYRLWTSGYAPEWSDSLWSGFPLLADPTSMSLYWPNLLAFLATPEPHLRAYDLATAMHAGILVSGTVLLMRILGAGVTASLLSGTLILFAPMHVWYASAMLTGYGPVAWWPWMFVAAEMLSRDRPPLVYLVVAWIALASCATIYPEFAFYGGTIASLWLLTRSAGARFPVRLLRVILMGLGGVAIAAPQLIPTTLLLPDVSRGTDGIGQDAAVSLFQLDRLLYPDTAEKIPSFSGIATLTLALIGTAYRGPRRLFLGLVAVLTYLIAIGTPFYDLIHSLPIFEMFRQPMKFKLLSELAIAILAGFGFDQLLATYTHPTTRQLIVLLAFMAASENLAYIGPRASTGNQLPGDTDTPFREVYERIQASRLPYIARVRPLPPGIRVSENVGFRNVPMIDRVGIAGGGPPAMLPTRHKRLIGALLSGSGPTSNELTHFGVGYHVGPFIEPSLYHARTCPRSAREGNLLLADARGDTCLYLNKIQPRLHEIAARPIRANTMEEMVDELERRLRADSTVITARHQEPLSLSSEANSTPATVLVHHHVMNGAVQVVAPPIEIALRQKGLGRVGVGEYRPGNFEVAVSTNRPAFLIVKESLYDGWQAFVNDKPAPIYPAAGLFFAVPVEPGENNVVLHFRSPGFRRGIQVAAAWIVLVCIWELARRTIRRLPREAP